MPYYPNQPPRSLPVDSVTDDLLANMPDGTVKGREIGAGAGDPSNIGRALSYRNILGRNGGFEVWQRGAGGAAQFFPIAAATPQYTADGWHLFNNAGQISGVFQIAGIALGSRWAAYVRRESGQTGVGNMYFQYALDTDEIASACGSIVTLSFTAKAAAGWSPAGGTLTAVLYLGTGPAARRGGTAFAGETFPIIINAPLTAVATRFTGTTSVVVPTNATQASVQFQWFPVGTAVAEDAFWLDDVQLEIGTIATPFERRPFEQELLACRRHYFKTHPYNIAPAHGYNDAWNSFMFTQVVGPGGSMSGAGFSLPVPMRSPPTVVLTNPAPAGVSGQVRNFTTGTDCTATSTTQLGMNAIAVGCTTPGGSGAGNILAVGVTADAGI